MNGIEYGRLTEKEKRCYEYMVKRISAFATEFSFKNVTFESVEKTFHAVWADNPRFFWLSGGFKASTLTRGTETTVKITPNFCDGINPGNVKSRNAAFVKKVNEIVSLAKRYGKPYDRALFVHDYLVDNTEYLLNAPQCYSAYGCIINKRAVCAGYSAAYQTILNQLGITCGRVQGFKKGDYTGDGHEWNYVKLEGDYYFVDVTWDDPIAEGSSSRSNKTHDYFCITTEETEMTHRIKSDGFVPECKSEKLNYYNYYGMYLPSYSFDKVKVLAAAQLKKKGRFTIKFSSAREAKKALKDLVKNEKVYSISGICGRITYCLNKAELALTISRA